MQLRPKSRFLIRAHESACAQSALSAFIASLEDEPDIELVDQIGPPERPHTIVVAVFPEQAAALEQRVHSLPHLMIEPDRPLSLFPLAP